MVQGKDLAILWDTGQGKQDLAAYLAERVRTPYLVCNSHGHADHIGGNFRFSGVYAHPADWPLLEAHARMTGRDWHAAPLEAGMSADLGGRRSKSFPWRDIRGGLSACSWRTRACSWQGMG